MGVAENSIIHRTWWLIPCISTLGTEVLQCSKLVYISYNYDLLLFHLWISCNCISICFYLFIYTASLFMWLFVFASFSVLCPSIHIFCICYCSCKTLFMCPFHHPFCLICLTAWLSQYWFSYIFLCVCTFIILPASVYLSLPLWLIACQFLSLSFTLL